MTVIRPNSISGITSITAQANEINMFRSDGTLAGLQINGINFNNTSGISTLAALNVTGNVSIAGTLTYQDVTNVDSVGLITARSNILVGSGITLSPDGDVFAVGVSSLGTGSDGGVELFHNGVSRLTAASYGIAVNGDILLSDALVHIGDTNTRIRFPDADTITAETAGSERVRITSDGKVGINSTSPSSQLEIHTDASAAWKFRINTSVSDGAGFYQRANGDFEVVLRDASNNNNNISGSAGGLQFTTANSERLRITSDGRVLVNSTTSRNIGANISRMMQIESSGGGAGIAVVRNSDNTSGPTLDLGKSRGYPNTIVQDGDKLGIINFSGADGTNLQTSAAQISGEVDGTPGSSDMPGRIVFKTTADGGSSTVERLRIDSRGAVTKPNNPAFFARPPANYNLSGDTIVGGTWSTSDSEAFVRGTLTNGSSIWDNSTGIFTVPVTGIYYFHWNVFLKNNTTRRDAMIYVNGTGTGNIIARTEIGDPGEGSNNKSVAVSAVVSLSVNDEIKFGCLTAGTANKIYQVSKPWSYACGYLVG